MQNELIYKDQEVELLANNCAIGCTAGCGLLCGGSCIATGGTAVAIGVALSRDAGATGGAIFG